MGIKKALLGYVRTLAVLESQDQQDFCSKMENEQTDKYQKKLLQMEHDQEIQKVKMFRNQGNLQEKKRKDTVMPLKYLKYKPKRFLRTNWDQSNKEKQISRTNENKWKWMENFTISKEQIEIRELKKDKIRRSWDLLKLSMLSRNEKQRKKRFCKELWEDAMRKS